MNSDSGVQFIARRRKVGIPHSPLDAGFSYIRALSPTPLTLAASLLRSLCCSDPVKNPQQPTQLQHLALPSLH